MATYTLTGRSLRLALHAAAAASPDAGVDALRAAWVALQRLRHTLEEGVTAAALRPSASESPLPSAEHDPAQLARILELLAPYVLGERQLNRDVDADALRCWIMLINLGGAGALIQHVGDVDGVSLLAQMSQVVTTRALADPDRADNRARWRVTPYLRDVCALGVAVLAVELVRFQAQDTATATAAGMASSGTALAVARALGAQAHEAMARLAERASGGAADNRRNKEGVDALSVLDKVQAAYMSVLAPDKLGAVAAGGPAAKLVSWMPVALPVLCVAVLLSDGTAGAFEAMGNIWVVAALAGVLLLAGASWLAPRLLYGGNDPAQTRERAARVSRLLVEMALYLRPQRSADAVDGELLYTLVEAAPRPAPATAAAASSPGLDGNDRAGAIGNYATATMAGGAEKQDRKGVHEEEEDEGGERASAAGATAVQAAAGAAEDIDEAAMLQMMQVAQGLGKVVCESLGVDANTSTEADTVAMPFPPELLATLEKLERMMRDSGADPAEIEKITARVALVRGLQSRAAENNGSAASDTTS